MANWQEQADQRMHQAKLADQRVIDERTNELARGMEGLQTLASGVEQDLQAINRETDFRKRLWVVTRYATNELARGMEGLQTLASGVEQDLQAINRETDFWKGLGVVTRYAPSQEEYPWEKNSSILVTLKGSVEQLSILSTNETVTKFGRYRASESRQGPDNSTVVSEWNAFGNHKENAGRRIQGYEVVDSGPYVSVIIKYEASHWSPYACDVTVPTIYKIELNDRELRYNAKVSLSESDLYLSELDSNSSYQHMFLSMINRRKGIPSLREQQIEAVRRNRIVKSRIDRVKGRVISYDDYNALTEV